MKRSTFRSASFNPRILIALLLCAAAAGLTSSGTLLAFSRDEVPESAQRTLTVQERVWYQRAIEEVYWRHRIWPKERPDPKQSLDAVMSQALLERKVTDYLRNSQALEDYWHRPITADQLQAEVERMATHTKQPEVLREIFAALGNDPFVIAECLARSVLAERLITELYAHDQRFHGELKRRAEAELQGHQSIEQMKQLSGDYSEVELVRSDSVQEQADHSHEHSLKLHSHEWDKTVQKLAAPFNKSSAGNASAFGERRSRPVGTFESADMSAHSRNSPADTYETIPMGKRSSIQEDETLYYAVAVMKKGKNRLKLATIAWVEEPLRSWVAKAETQVPVTMAALSANYTLPVIASPLGGCTRPWTATSTTNAPDARLAHTAVWTGSEMIVWGGAIFGPTFFNTGGRYNPGTDSWAATSTTNAPDARGGHTAVWTGSEMIVWGGNNSSSYLNTGGRYNPGTDSWAATSTTNAPDARGGHTAVWTGSEMIIWGGNFGGQTGGRYNPGTDSWTATSTTNAPDARFVHTAVWTGSEMIVWGGLNPTPLNTGGRYNPGTDSWTATSTTDAPDARDGHTAVWTGSEMIVWGGAIFGPTFFNTGGRYNPGTDSWTATSTTNAPDARDGHTAVWTGSEMIVWGGSDGMNYFNTGRRYNPSIDGWVATTTNNAPAPRSGHTAVWTGNQMIVWGGLGSFGNIFDTGGRYCVASDLPPRPTSTPRPRPTPHPRL